MSEEIPTIEDVRIQNLISEFTAIYPDTDIPKPLEVEVFHSNVVPEEYQPILHPSNEDLQEELDGILDYAFPPPAPTTSHELMLETISAANNVSKSYLWRSLPPRSDIYCGPSLLDNYLKYCTEDLRMKFSEEQQSGIYRVWNRVTNWVIYAKYKYLRPRPVALSKNYGIPITVNIKEDYWNNTPSYPSLRYALMLTAAKYFSHSHRSCYPKLIQKAVDMERYLIATGTNFSSDIAASKDMIQDNLFSAEEVDIKQRQADKLERQKRKQIERAKKNSKKTATK
jgi:hypothetical protein